MGFFLGSVVMQDNSWNSVKLTWDLKSLLYLYWAWTKMAASVALFISLMLFISGSSAVYYGAEIGDFANRFHQIKGKVYAVDSRTIFIKVRSVKYGVIFKEEWDVLDNC